MAANKKLVQGVELLEFAIPNSDGSLGGVSWKRFENVAPGTVNYTSNSDNQSSIIPEDKDSPVIVLTTPGDPDTFNFGLLELSDENFNVLFNTDYDAATSTVTVQAKRKKANLAIRLTTRPVNGVKKVITYPNTDCVTTYANNFTKDALVQFGVAASVLSYTSIAGKEAIYSIQTVKADGSNIDGTPPTVSAGTDSTTSTATKALTGTATAKAPKTVSSTTWTQISGPNQASMTAANALTNTVGGLITGVYVFQLTATDSDGVSAASTVKLTATIP